MFCQGDTSRSLPVAIYSNVCTFRLCWFDDVDRSHFFKRTTWSWSVFGFVIILFDMGIVDVSLMALFALLREETLRYLLGKTFIVVWTCRVSRIFFPFWVRRDAALHYPVSQNLKALDINWKIILHWPRFQKKKAKSVLDVTNLRILYLPSI